MCGAATLRDPAKIAKYTFADPYGYAFISLSMESYGRLGKPAMGLLNTLEAAAAASGVVKDTFVANALREFSIGLCRGNGALSHRVLGSRKRNCFPGRNDCTDVRCAVKANVNSNKCEIQP